MKRPAPRVGSSTTEVPRLSAPPLAFEKVVEKPALAPHPAPTPRRTAAIPRAALFYLAEALPSDYYLG